MSAQDFLHSKKQKLNWGSGKADSGFMAFVISILFFFGKPLLSLAEPHSHVDGTNNRKSSSHLYLAAISYTNLLGSGDKPRHL